MRKIFTLFVLLLCLKNTKAQFVTISDTVFVAWLQNNTATIMSGNQMDTTSFEFAFITKIDVSYQQIWDLTGIKYFKSLKYLKCNGNILANFNAEWPNSLDSLDCSDSYIGSLGNLPDSLIYLKCETSQLTFLPNIPITLKELRCFNNFLDSIPNLPNTMRILSFQDNNISSIPGFPDSLLILDCAINLLTSLPTLPLKLNILNCYYNSLTLLPTLPDSLKVLDCEHNLLTTLPPLPNKLKYLLCGNNQLTTLPNLPNNLNYLHCQSNNITCFPIFPDSIYVYNLNINPFTCLPNYTSNMQNYLLAYPLCNATNIFGCQQSVGIAGNIFLDTNSNCLKNILEKNLVNISMKVYNSGSLLKQTTTSLDSTYNFSIPVGTYNVVLDTINKPYETSCTYPGVDSLVIVGNSQTLIDGVDFPVVCKPGFDIGIQSINRNGMAFPGQTHTLNINAGDMSHWYNLNCASGLSGVLSFTVSGPVTYIGPAVGSLTPNVTGNIFTYNIADFGTINNSNDFKLIFQTSASAQALDDICINGLISPTNGDNNVSNNSKNYCYQVVNSYDPNIKEVYPINVQPSYNDWLTYTIHFQNTGNASAFNINLTDSLDSMLDLETFEVINYSHKNIIDINGNILTVRYPNIMLPDSFSNPSGSIGFIQYRIKPKSSWMAPYKIKNTAYIYFDYNSPIMTNTTYNSIVIDIGIKELYEKSVVIYPNPTNGSFTIELNNKEKQFIKLFDITGNIVLSQTIENGQGTVDASHLAAGVYTINIKGNSTVINKKVVIVK